MYTKLLLRWFKVVPFNKSGHKCTYFPGNGQWLQIRSQIVYTFVKNRRHRCLFKLYTSHNGNIVETKEYSQ